MGRKQSIALIEAALANAHELLADSQLLLGGERWARAHALAVFAMEEIGKAWLAYQHLGFADKGATLQPSRDHVAKLIAAHQMESFVAQSIANRSIDMEVWFAEDHDYAAQDDFDERMAGVYVDLVDGAVVGGTRSVSKQQAEYKIDVANSVVHFGLAVMSNIPEEDRQREDREAPL